MALPLVAGAASAVLIRAASAPVIRVAAGYASRAVVREALGQLARANGIGLPVAGRPSPLPAWIRAGLGVVRGWGEKLREQLSRVWDVANQALVSGNPYPAGFSAPVGTRRTNGNSIYEFTVTFRKWESNCSTSTVVRSSGQQGAGPTEYVWAELFGGAFTGPCGTTRGDVAVYRGATIGNRATATLLTFVTSGAGNQSVSIAGTVTGGAPNVSFPPPPTGMVGDKQGVNAQLALPLRSPVLPQLQSAAAAPGVPLPPYSDLPGEEGRRPPVPLLPPARVPIPRAPGGSVPGSESAVPRVNGIPRDVGRAVVPALPEVRAGGVGRTMDDAIPTTGGGVLVTPGDPAVPVTSPDVVLYPGIAVGQAGAIPRADAASMARELGKIEQKLGGLLGGLGAAEGLQSLLDLLGAIDLGTTYSIQPPCGTDANGDPLPPVEVVVPPTFGWNTAIVARLDALAMLIDEHKQLRQPICKGKPTGSPVTVTAVEIE